MMDENMRYFILREEHRVPLPPLVVVVVDGAEQQR
jgi:hypothetical protein